MIFHSLFTLQLKLSVHLSVMSSSSSQSSSSSSSSSSGPYTRPRARAQLQWANDAKSGTTGNMPQAVVESLLATNMVQTITSSGQGFSAQSVAWCDEYRYVVVCLALAPGGHREIRVTNRDRSIPVEVEYAPMTLPDRGDIRSHVSHLPPLRPSSSSSSSSSSLSRFPSSSSSSRASTLRRRRRRRRSVERSPPRSVRPRLVAPPVLSDFVADSEEDSDATVTYDYAPMPPVLRFVRRESSSVRAPATPFSLCPPTNDDGTRTCLYCFDDHKEACFTPFQIWTCGNRVCKECFPTFFTKATRFVFLSTQAYLSASDIEEMDAFRCHMDCPRRCGGVFDPTCLQ